MGGLSLHGYDFLRIPLASLRGSRWGACDVNSGFHSRVGVLLSQEWLHPVEWLAGTAGLAWVVFVTVTQRTCVWAFMMQASDPWHSAREGNIRVEVFCSGYGYQQC